MKVLVLGTYGMLGHMLFLQMEKDFDVYGTCRTIRLGEPWSWMFPPTRVFQGVQADDLGSVQKAIAKTRPDAVVNCVGIIKQIDAAKDQAISMDVNALFPHKLALICKKEKARLIHFSTDCVFSGAKGNYTHDDIPDAEDVYGKTKYLGELSGEGCVTIRSSIIGRELGTRNGLVEWFLSQKGKKVNAFTRAIYSGFTTIEMGRIVAKLLKEHDDLSGVWQVASKPISKHDLLRLIKDKMSLDIDIVPDSKVVIDRSLDGSLFNKRTGYKPPSWESMVDELAKDSKLYDGGFKRG